MKNWKFIKVENTAHSDKVDVIKRLLAGGWSVQDIYEQLKTEGYEVEKNFIEKLKTGNYYPGIKFDGVSDQELKNWIRLDEQDIREAQREMEKWKRHTEGDYSGDQYNSAMTKYNEAKKNKAAHEEELNRRKTGNELPNDAEIKYKGYIIRYYPYQGKYLVEHKTDFSKTNPFIGKKFSTSEEAIREIEKLSVGNKKVGNESIKSQEWSMFKGLSKDAEKEVGNDESDLIKKGFVYKVNIPGKRPIYFNNPRQAQIAAEAQNGTVEKIGNKEVGNFKTGKSKLSVGDKVSLYGVKGTVKGITGENSDNIYGEPVIEFESEDGKTKQIPEHYLVKVGNSQKEFKSVEELDRWCKQNGYMYEERSKGYYSLTNGKDFTTAHVGNSYTPNPELIKVLEAWLHNRMSEQEARAKIMKITGDKNITDMMIHSPGGFIPVGNKGQWDSKKMVYAKWDEGKGRPSEEFAKITWLGDGKGGLVNVWKGSQMTSEKFGSNDLEELRRWAEQRIGNADPDKELKNEYNAEIHRLEKKAEQLRNMGQGRSAMKVEEQIEKLEWELMHLFKAGNKKTGNALPHQIADILELEISRMNKGEYDTAFKRAVKDLERIGVSTSEARGYAGDPRGWVRKIYEQRDLGNKKTGNAQTNINGEWKDTKSPKEQLIEYAKKSNDPEYLEHVKKMTNPNDINARLQWHKKSGNEQKTNNLCRARNAIKTKNGMGVSDLEAQIRKNKEFIRQQKMRMNGKSKPEQDDIAEGIREAEEEIDRMEMRIAELKETGNKKVGNKKYHVWTDNGSWDMIVDEKELEGLKRTYKNFHYEEVKEG